MLAMHQLLLTNDVPLCFTHITQFWKGTFWLNVPDSSPNRGLIGSPKSRITRRGYVEISWTWRIPVSGGCI